MTDPTTANKEVFEIAFELVAEENEASAQYKAVIERFFAKDPNWDFEGWPYKLANQAPNAAQVYAALTPNVRGQGTGAQAAYHFAVSQRLSLSRRLSNTALTDLYRRTCNGEYADLWSAVEDEAPKRGITLR